VAEPTPIRSQRTRFSTVFDLAIAALCWRWRRFEIADDSMLPTLSHGDWTLGIRSGDLRVGDLVVVAMPDRPGFLIVKRVAAADTTDGSFWLEADNSDGVDSRQFGWVPAQSVRARLVTRYHPWPPRLLS
jgi:hypothetical protein